MSADSPTHFCGYSIEGPKTSRRVVPWRRGCLNRVKAPGERCWRHRGYR